MDRCNRSSDNPDVAFQGFVFVRACIGSLEELAG